MKTPFTPRLAPQRGVTLVVVLLILVVVTVLGIGGAQIALLGERATRFDRDYLIASQSAEAALMDAEFDIRGPGTSTRKDSFNQTDFGNFVEGCGNSGTVRGLCMPNADTAKPVWATVDFLDESNSAHTVKYGTFTGRAFELAGDGKGIRPAREPRYIIELVDDAGPGGNAAGRKTSKMYRITAIGFGPRSDIQVVMQTAFRKEKG